MKTQRSMCPAARAIRRRPSLSRTFWAATALKHMAADESCGRVWSCACGACRAAREALGPRYAANTIKRCACGESYTKAEWKALPFVGYYNDNAPADPEHPEAGEPKGWCEMRNCTCGSTIMMQCALVDGERAFFGVPYIDAAKTFAQIMEDT